MNPTRTTLCASSPLRIPYPRKGATKLSAALTWAQAGWYVIPVDPNAATASDMKNPGSLLGAKWQTNSSNDPAQIRKWWKATPDANIAIHVGRSGAVAFDVDNPAKLPAWMAAEFKGQPYLTTSASGSRRHYLFTQPEGRSLSNSLGALPKGWGEIRGNNGVLMVYPSQHAEEKYPDSIKNADDPGAYGIGKRGPLSEVPAVILEKMREASDDVRRATRAEVKKFMAEHTGEDNLAAMKGPINAYRKRDGARHEVMRDVLCWAFREAYAGAYPAAEAAAQLRELWVESFRDGSGDDRMPGNGEWERLLEFAVGAALASDPEETRTKMSRTKAGTRGRSSAGKGLDVDLPHHKQVEAVFANFAASNPREQRFFQQGGARGGLVTVEPGNANAFPVNEPVLETRVSETMRVYAMRDGHPQDATISPRVLRSVLAEHRPRLPRLQRITRAPFYAADGRLVDVHGYDPEAKTFCDLSGFELLDVPRNPSTRDVREAKRLLLDVMMYDFPFESRADKANALALPLEMLVRDMIDGPVPMHLFRANLSRTGKSKLGRALCSIPMRQNPVARGFKTRQELDKELMSALRETPPVLFLDNIKVVIDSEALERLVTEPRAGARLLGGNDLLEVEARNSWVMTANHPELSRDSANRAVLTGLHSKVARPENRKDFKIKGPFDRWVRERNSELLRALFVLVNSWAAAGFPDGPLLSSHFEEWQRVIGGILAHNEIPGLMANQDRFLHDSVDRAGEDEWDEAYDRWEEHFGIGKPAAAGELLNLLRCTGKYENFDDSWHPLELGINGRLPDASLGKELGKKLAVQASAPPRGGRVIRKADPSDGVNARAARGAWVLDRVEP